MNHLQPIREGKKQQETLSLFNQRAHDLSDDSETGEKKKGELKWEENCSLSVTYSISILIFWLYERNLFAYSWLI